MVPRLPFALLNLLMSLFLLAIGIGTCVAAGFFNLDRWYNSPGTLRTFAD